MDKISFVGVLLIVFGGLLVGIRLLGLVDFGVIPFGILIGMIGFILFAYPSTQVPSVESKVLIKESLLNIEAMLNSYDASEHCFYLPPEAGKMYVYVPLSHEITPSEAWAAVKAPLKTVTEVNNKPGLIIFTPFSFILKTLNKNMHIDEALSRILVNRFEVAESVRVGRSGDEISLEISQPLSILDLPRCEKVLGSYCSYLAGNILSAQLVKPVVLVNEDFIGQMLRCRFKVSEYE